MGYSELVEIIDNLRGSNQIINEQQDDDVCSECNGGGKKINDNNIYVCTNCGDCVQRSFYVSTLDELGGGKMCKKSVYKRSNYFDNLLNRLQAKNFIAIEPEILGKLKNEKVNNIKELKCELKKMNLPEYYKYASYILTLLNGTSILRTLTANETITIKNRFNKLQEFYEKNKPTDKINFLNYNFVLHQLIKEIGRDDLCCFISLPKNKNIMKKHNALWEKMNIVQ